MWNGRKYTAMAVLGAGLAVAAATPSSAQQWGGAYGYAGGCGASGYAQRHTPGLRRHVVSVKQAAYLGRYGGYGGRGGYGFAGYGGRSGYGSYGYAPAHYGFDGNGWMYGAEVR